ncbi:PrsW family intramembrane metalloprotease [Corynebacterium lowii]|uniref:Protease PrsW n=1 Tax=Corynebacterium lowii TaxID=1544413 RepID=A0A0N8W0T6_9CORY|nr:PrsW family intramembrane metalloprotease [Corynebacterium lowii]KQB87602.1 hypothetical protein Clow_00662 [Corynebacterium lowii]MDP9851802.1 RsiW-degrading membrane proteinase PrsW (M82 family) [Corynebacterium lowii]
MIKSSSQETNRLPFVLIFISGLFVGAVTIYRNIAATLQFNPTGVILGSLFGLCYIVIFSSLFFLLKLLPSRYVVWLPAAILWGSGTVTTLVYESGQGMRDLFPQLGLSIFAASFAGAWPEEIGKAVGVLLILLSFRSLNKPWHGLVVGFFVGLGFTILEDIGYGSVAGLLDPSSDVSGVVGVWMIRTLAGPAQHAVYSGIIGFGLGLALFSEGRYMRWRWGVAAAFFALGFGCHFLWNISPESMAVSLVAMASAAVIGYGAFIYLAVKCYRENREMNSVGL